MARRTFRVRWAEAAALDLQELTAYIATDSPDYADRLLTTLEHRAASLQTTPARGRMVPELSRFGMRTWRELIIESYRLIYRIERRTVYVLAVLDGRRDLQDLLLARLLRDR